jgi:predicted XRE-type DNA-binding protein
MTDSWMTMKEAAKTLGISNSRISRLASIGAIEVKTSTIDKRIKVVNVDQIKELIETKGINFR